MPRTFFQFCSAYCRPTINPTKHPDHCRSSKRDCRQNIVKSAPGAQSASDRYERLRQCATSPETS